MKTVIITAIIIGSLSLTACNNNGNKTKETASSESSATQFSCPMHPEVVGNKGDKCSKCGMELTEPFKETIVENTENKSTVPGTNIIINEVVANYLILKNALTKDNSKAAANAGNTIVEILAKIEMKSLSKEQMNSYMEVADDLKENAEHIGSNGGKIDHQREHFVLLSKDINDLITTFGSDKKLYQDFCPMADDGKGAIWISETKDISNPYLGAKMPTCGSIKKEY